MMLAKRDNSICLEQRIIWDEIADAYRNHPHLHGNPQVLALLVDVQNNLDKNHGDREQECDESYENGNQYGYSAAIKEWHPEIEGTLKTLSEAIEKIEGVNDALEELKETLNLMEMAA